MTKDLVIFGAGGFARELFWTVRDINRVRSQWRLLGFLDERPGEWGRELYGLPVMDPARIPAGCFAAHGVGSPELKRRIALEFEARGIPFATLIHPSVITGPGVRIGHGAIVQAGSILTVDCTIASHVTINLDCTVGHDAVIGSYATISPGAHISGNCAIGPGCYIGTGAALREKLTVGPWSVIGANAAVVADVPAGVVSAGVPAGILKTREAPHERK